MPILIDAQMMHFQIDESWMLLIAFYFPNLYKFMGLAENWVPNNFIIDGHAPHHSLAVFRGPPPFFGRDGQSHFMLLFFSDDIAI